MRKPFDEELFRDNDQRARAAVMAALNEDGIHAHPNPDKYAADLVVYSGYRHTHYIECEIKLVWKASQDTFPWDTVQVPERKLKFTRDGAPTTPTGRKPQAHTWKECEYWILREDCGMAVIIPEQVLSSSPRVIVPNKLVGEGEVFAQVPLDQCILRKL